jgi:ubiquinol-cytochrome c reductase iron-sulfur subunit
MTAPHDPNRDPDAPSSNADENPALRDTGGQTPTSEPRGGMTSSEAAGSIRDRLSSPVPSSRANTGGDSRGSDVTADSFRQTDSAQRLSDEGRDERQLSHSSAPEPVDMAQERPELVDPTAARAAERNVAILCLLSVVGVVGFFVVYWFFPYKYGEAGNALYTPLLGVTMALALSGIGAGTILWAKTLMSDEEAVQERHPFVSPDDEKAATVKTLSEGYEASGLPRRSMLRNSLLLGAGSLALLPVPLLFGLGPYAHKERVLGSTGWRKGARLIRSNGTPVRLGDLTLGGVESVFPDVPRGTKLADSATLLIRMSPDELKVQPGREGWDYQGHIAYSVICTHLGCPVKLYEQETHHLFCPCHQSTFAADDGAKVLFGPAARNLPQLAISVDPDGYFVAEGDYDQPVGPSFWERKP